MNVSSNLRTYVAVYFTLVLLTLLTCGLSFVHQVNWHATVGLGIAAIKAGLIAVFFMHVLVGDRLPWLALFAGILWFSILLGLTLTDYLTRATLSY